MPLKYICSKKLANLKIINKALVEKNSVKLDYISAKNIGFLVKGEKEVHSVIYLSNKGWVCDCKYFTLHNKICSHIAAVNLKIEESALFNRNKK